MFALVPILAQMATTLAVGDRTEVRARFDEYAGTADAATTPYGSVNFASKRESLTLRYSPWLTLSVVPGSDDRIVTVFHTAQVIGQLRLRRAVFTVSETADYGTRNFVVDAYGDRSLGNAPPPTGAPAAAPGTATPGTGTPGTGTPTPGTGTPGTGTSGTGSVTRPTVAARPFTVRYADLITQANVTYALSKRSSAGAFFRYVVAGGLDEESRAAYPTIYNPSLGVFYGYTIDKRSSVGSTLQSSYSTSALGIQTYTADFNLAYRYRFTKALGVALGGGIGYARIVYADGQVLEYIYLTAGTGAGIGVEYTTKLYGGILTLYARFGYTPTLDQVSAVLDPRLGWAVGASWRRRSLSLYANLSSTISVKQTSQGSLDAFYATMGASYVLGAGFVGDIGARGVWQAFEGTTTVPASAVLFAGLSWGASTTLGGRR